MALAGNWERAKKHTHTQQNSIVCITREEELTCEEKKKTPNSCK